MLLSTDSEISGLSQNNDSTALIGEEMVQSLQAELDGEETLNDTNDIRNNLIFKRLSLVILPILVKSPIRSPVN